ncbi:DUF636 domain-containing protein [Macrolepiota fuliginosa MF-IS2]|uniref:DUF636 domain-containing protein n=1 Tax=Macrolepiota fuliginosa MF-IS2 TaxID=1400762 RepID=A0A9P5XDC0_9AGAR|nr:DUF636 domain-containing protein [Macrolepiota fuliginosa MF-IS2]
MSSSAKVRRGTCLCKTVRYEVTEEPFHYTLCHCSNCKKSAGSAFMAHSYWKPDQLKIIEGESFIRHYSDNDTQSANTITRSFCTNCGSSLFVKPAKGDFIIAQPSAIEGHQAWAPKKEFYSGNRAEWLKDITFVTNKSKL